MHIHTAPKFIPSPTKQSKKMSNKLEAARRELALATDAVAQMANATDTLTLDKAWKDCLGRLTRLWNKTQASLKGDPRFYNSPWVKQVKEAQKSDPLVKYLLHARNADEHGIENVTDHRPGVTTINPLTPGGPVFINHLAIGGDGNITRLDAGSPLRIEIRPATVMAKPVTDRGQTYPVPEEHAGAKITNPTLIEFAKLGVAFYETFIEGLARDGWDSVG